MSRFPVCLRLGPAMYFPFRKFLGRALDAACLFLLASVLSGCVTAPLNGEVQPVASLVPILSGPTAEVIVLNVSGWTLVPSNQNITDNGATFASLPRQTYTSVRVAPGRHEFRFDDSPRGPRVALLDAEAGRRYYLAAGYSPSHSYFFPFGGDPVTIRMISEDEARPLMSEMKSQ